MEDSLEDYIKLVRNTKDVKKTEVRKKISEKELVVLQRKKECESNAVKIVEFLIEGQLSSQVFLRCLSHINPAYYQDIVEERAISKLCGYPLCGKALPEMPKKQYFINTKCNKVYDVRDRKNYCSNLCYKASIHIKKQIDNSPLWSRKHEEDRKIYLLPDCERGIPGEEIDQGVIQVPKDYEFTSISTFTEISLADIDEMESKDKSGMKRDNRLESLEELDETILDDDKTFEEPHPSTIINPINKSTKSKTTSKKGKHKLKSASPEKLLDKIQKHIYEWITFDTLLFLYGEAKLEKELNEKELKEYLKKSQETEATLARQRRYLEICRKLRLTQLTEDMYDNDVINRKTRPIPDYAKLKEESKSMDLKIRSFYSGSSFEAGGNTDKPEDEGKEGVPAVLPLMEASTQKAIRQKIYLNSLEKIVHNLSHTLGLPSQSLLKDIQLLVKTFRLQANNIVFQPAVWSLIALVLIHMLSVRDNSLRRQLETEQSQKFIKLMLNKLPNADSFMRELFENLVDVKLFLKQYFMQSKDCVKE